MAPAWFGLFSLAKSLTHQLAGRDLLRVRGAAWSAKPRPTLLVIDELHWVGADKLLAFSCVRADRNLTRGEWNHHIGIAMPYEKVCLDLFPPRGW